jgi:putative heme transporter
MAGSAEGEGSSGGFRRGPVLLVALATAGLYVGGAAAADIGDALAELTGASVLPLLGAVLAQVAVTLVWPLVHRASVRAVGADLRYREALNISLSAFTLSHTMPGGGAVGAAVAVSRLRSFGLSGPAATASVSLTGPLSVTTVALVGAAGIATAVVAGDLPRDWAWLAALVLLVLLTVVAGIVAALRSPAAGDRMVSWLGRLPKLDERVGEWRSALRAVTEDDPPASGDLARIVGWSALKWTADLLSLALVFVAFGQTPRLTVLLVGFGVSQVAAAIPVTPGGIGFVEGGMVAAFVALGAPLSVATSVVLGYRLVETWMPTIAGIPAILRPPAP